MYDKKTGPFKKTLVATWHNGWNLASFIQKKNHSLEMCYSSTGLKNCFTSNWNKLGGGATGDILGGSGCLNRQHHKERLFPAPHVSLPPRRCGLITETSEWISSCLLSRTPPRPPPPTPDWDERALLCCVVFFSFVPCLFSCALRAR